MDAHTPFPRRKLLQAGSLGTFGLSVAQLFRAEAAGRTSGGPGPACRSCILVFYYGGPSQLETWDPKPDAPAEIRGEFRPIETSAPGIRIGEHLPLCARQMHHMALLRGMHHPMRNHNSAAAETLTGRTPLGGDQELLQDDIHSFPCYGGALTYALHEQQSPLAAVSLPHVMYNVVVLPGQRAGFLGPRFDPLQVAGDGETRPFRVPDLELPPGLSADRLGSRRVLMRQVEAQVARSDALASAQGADVFSERAFSLLSSGTVRSAFDLEKEPAGIRDRYGRNVHGQSMLLARRLVEAGARFVSVYDRVHNGQEANWDSHQAVFPRSRDHLLPPADRALSALISDLSQRGLLDSTLIIALGEFGRTPKINKDAGRDHWPDCFSVALAGGGVRGGTVFGASDEHGAYPAADGVTPADLAATLFWRFGLNPSLEIRDQANRPYRLAAGEPLRSLFG
jgi:hypothetical protein